jgi:hypothetical protein
MKNKGQKDNDLKISGVLLQRFENGFRTLFLLGGANILTGTETVVLGLPGTF